MYNPIRFESTQERGRRIDEAISMIAWDDIPEDSLTLKEYESQRMQEDPMPQYKPNIKNTLREFWELREETFHDSQKKVQMEKTEKEKAYRVKKSADRLEVQGEAGKSIKSTPIQKPSKKISKQEIISGEKESYRKGNESYENKKNQSRKERPRIKSISKTQPTEYMVKLAKALEEPKAVKAKFKVSQKLNFPLTTSLSALICKRKKGGDLNESSVGMKDQEDIEDCESIDENVYTPNKKGQKKVKMEFQVKVEMENKNPMIIEKMDKIEKEDVKMKIEVLGKNNEKIIQSTPPTDASSNQAK